MSLLLVFIDKAKVRGRFAGISDKSHAADFYTQDRSPT
jgi:hypothetical protein